MRKFTKLIGLTAILFALGACSKSNDNGAVTDVDAIAFSAKVNGSSTLATKADNFSYYEKGKKLYVGIISNSPDIDATLNGKRTTSLTVTGENSSTELTSNPLLYWNDMGGRNADVNIWGVYYTLSNVSVTEFGKLTWKIAADQSAGHLPYDLHWSNNVKNLGFKTTANLEFRHAMSKITINLTVGEGFTAADANSTVVTLKNNFTSVNVDVPNGALSGATATADITPQIVSPFNSGMKATYEAIVSPLRSLNVGDVIATISLGSNLYTVKSQEVREYESGKNYVYNVSVKKSGVTFVSSTIVDWEEVEGSADSQIVFTAGDGDGATNGTGVNALNNSTGSFNIFTSHDNSNFDADNAAAGTQPSTSVSWVPASGTEGTADYVPGHWANDVPVYWADDNDDSYFRALSPSDATESDNEGNFNFTTGDNDYIWGTSGNDPKHPTTGNVGLSFTHVTAKVVITVITTDGTDAVDLTTISKQTISGIATTGKFNVNTGTYADFTSDNYGEYTMSLSPVEGANNKKYSCEFYVLPQTLTNDSKVNVTVGTAPTTNEFHQQLNTIMAAGVPVTKWEAGKRYVYTILLKKTEKSFTAMLTDWFEVITEDTTAEL